MAWPLFLEQKSWRKSETGEIYLEASLEFSGTVDPHAKNPRIPFNSAKFPDETEIHSDSDISRTLKFARDNDWSCSLSYASTFDGTNAITVTYAVSLEDVEDKITWYWNKFVALAELDGLVGFPALARDEITWKRHCFIGDHDIHIVLCEVGVATTEEDGPPCFWIYAPRAFLKFRAESIDVAERMLTMCYNKAPDFVERHVGKFWALIARIDGGTIPKKFSANLEQEMSLELATAWNKDTLMEGLASEPYRTGTGKFVAQFKPDRPYSATIAIERGVHGEPGTAILFEQANRRCLVTRRIYKLSDEDTFWEVMKDWANFEPRLAKPRRDAGQIFYPAAYSHMFETHWDFIQAPTVEDALNVGMERYASAAALLHFSSTPLVDVEAPEKSQRISSAGALSRRLPVQDASDYWSSPQEQAQAECVTVEHGFAPASDVHNVDTDAGDSVPIPT
jgi:hypothetical protein